MAWYDNIPGVDQVKDNPRLAALAAGPLGFGVAQGKSLRDNPVSNFIFGAGPQQQPGVGGPAKDPSKLMRDPVTGMFYDPTTGTSYTDAGGQVVIANPNVAQQVATNAQRATAFLSQLGGLEQERKAEQEKQQALEGHFNAVLSGNAPSVAEMQARGLAQAGASQQLAQVAGASGASSPLAALMAARNTGQVYANANNAGAMGRVAEETAAGNALNALLANEAANTQRATDTTAGLGMHLTDTAATGQEAQQGLNRQADKEKAADEKSFGGGVLSTLSHLIGV